MTIEKNKIKKITSKIWKIDTNKMLNQKKCLGLISDISKDILLTPTNQIIPTNEKSNVI